MQRVFISIGSNIEPAANVQEAIRALASEVRVIAISTIYQTAPERHLNQPLFYNGVVEIETVKSPKALKLQLRAIEANLGRKRMADKYAPRTIDLDLLLYGNLVLKTGDLVLPDSDISNRSIVAIPLSELAPDLVLSGTLTSVSTLAASLPRVAMTPLREYTARLRRDAGINVPHLGCNPKGLEVCENYFAPALARWENEGGAGKYTLHSV